MIPCCMDPMQIPIKAEAASLQLIGLETIS